MEQNLVFLTFGAILGAVISIFTQFFFVSFKKHSENQLKLNRENIMHDVGDLCAEIDSLLISAKAGNLNSSGIQNILRKKHDEITKLIKPNQHFLDVYFVKYVESVQSGYLKLLSGENDDVDSLASSKKPVSLVIEKSEKSNVSELIDNGSQGALRAGSLEHDMHALEKAFFKDNDSDTSEEKSNSDISNENVAEISDETNTDVKNTDTPIAPVYHKKTPLHPIGSNESDAEEEFTMETIMDLDINKFKSAVLNDSKKIEAKKETSPVIPNDETESPLPDDKEDSPAPPPATTILSFEAELERSLASDDETTDSKEESSAQNYTDNEPVVQSNDKSDMEITGDDVADKIDQFFGNNK